MCLILHRLLASLARLAVQGRFLGGRPPYGCTLADAHPNPEKARIGQRLRRLEPDPAISAIVERIFEEFTAGSG